MADSRHSHGDAHGDAHGEAQGEPGLLSGLTPLVAEVVGQASSDAGQRLRQLGLPDAAKPAVLAALATTEEGRGRAHLILTATPSRAAELRESLPLWLPPDQQSRLLPFPARERIPYDRQPPDAEAVESRLRAVEALSGAEAPIVVTDVDAVLEATLSSTQAREGSASGRVTVGSRLNREALVRELDTGGYQHSRLVVEPSSYAVRGGIVDCWPPTDPLPTRIELFGNEVESLRRFDPRTQRGSEAAEWLNLRPAREWTAAASPQPRLESLLASVDLAVLSAVTEAEETADAASLRVDLEHLRAGGSPNRPDFWTPLLADGSIWDHLPPDAIVIVDEPHDLSARAAERDQQAERTRTELERGGRIPRGLPMPWQSAADLERRLCDRAGRVELLRLGGPEIRLPFRPAERLAGKLAELFERLRAPGDQGGSYGGARVLASLQAARLEELIADYGIAYRTLSPGAAPNQGAVNLARSAIGEGWRLDDPATGATLATLITDTEIFGFPRQHRARPSPRRRAAPPDSHLLETIQEGDFVVHVDQGIARFKGIVRETVLGREGEYLELGFAQGDRMLVPTDQLHRVQPYVGPSDAPPSLTRLGGGQWQRAKQRVRGAVAEIADDLLALHAARETEPGLAMSPDSAWQLELEASFPYIPTTDQQTAIEEVRRDQEASRPMDRLVVGDVGYGKTEVAVRAAFRAVMSGYQAALLVPTTVLAQQHFDTFTERLAAMNVRIALLSRLRTRAEQREAGEAIRSGAVDVVIGTHRLLQQDIEFKNLGLLVIDEEQRFGVEAKERLKRFRREVDVLTLSATPIPRTLHQAVSGIRDMSTIATPPEERLPITTQVMERDDSVIREAVLREIERGGQIYFLHNEVRTIDREAFELAKLIPEARFLVAHGQMPSAILQRHMRRFTAGEADVLVCSTIIESGLDIPRVNTIIIDRAERLGLAQLYQLRGRVGRASERAFAYLMTEPYRSLSEVAQRRLAAIIDASELGAGFQIALRDLEIRGAGNLLGAQQSGHIGAVGFTLFTQLLGEAVEQARAKRAGKPPPAPRGGPAVTVDLPVPRFLPQSYVDDLGQRLSWYQRLAAIESVEETERVSTELRDRYGPLPRPAEQLLETVELRVLASRLGAESVSWESSSGGGGAIVVRLVAGLSFTESQRRLKTPSGIEIGRTQLRYAPARPLSSPGWFESLRDVLSTLIRT